MERNGKEEEEEKEKEIETDTWLPGEWRLQATHESRGKRKKDSKLLLCVLA